MANKDEIKVPDINVGGENQLNRTFPASLGKKIIDADLEKERLDQETKKSERGWLGKLFGAGTAAVVPALLKGECICQNGAYSEMKKENHLTET